MADDPSRAGLAVLFISWGGLSRDTNVIRNVSSKNSLSGDCLVNLKKQQLTVNMHV